MEEQHNIRNQYEDMCSSFANEGYLRDIYHDPEDAIEYSRTKDFFAGNEGLYKFFFKDNKEAIILVNPENSEIIDANFAARKYYGWTRENIPRKIDDINALSNEDIKAENQRAAEEKRNYFLFKHRRANGEIRDVKVFSGSMALKSQSLFYYIVHDINEWNLAEEDLQRTELQLFDAGKIGPVGSWEFDLNSGKVSASDKTREIYGLESEEFTIEKMQKISMPKYRRMLDEAINDLVKKNATYDVQFKIIRPNDGNVRFIHSTAEYYNEKNIVIGMIQDITERNRAKSELREMDSLLNEVGRIAKIGGWELDVATGYITRTPEVARIYEIDNNEPVSLKFALSFYPSGSKELLEKAIQNTVEKGESFDLELEVISAKGNHKWISTIGHPKEKAGKVVKITGSLQDITERKLAEEELLNAKLVAVASTQVKTEFLATISHELRTPLTAVIGFSDILLDDSFGNLNETQIEYINYILKGGNHLLKIINDLIDLSTIETGNMELDYRLFYVSNAVDEIRTVLCSLARKKNIDLFIEVEPQLGVIDADKIKFKQILYHLASNAIKFTHEKGYVTIKAQRCGDFVQVSVKDTGIGISDDDMNKLFHPFKQLHSQLNRKYEGIGAGLAIVKKFVEMHGGEIRVESKERDGSIFSFLIPVNREVHDNKWQLV
ncbi:PAS domain-containing sensor histidine kinase [Methanolobus psychrotolerans]|uniref:PAS domain-containing sensor histidine kinase n=1 Tax=Methanolobus psychrotolerans TaxID=1874706 RepID=UPI000B9172C8|nr:PAS domain-containing sensor histidine kinase [Methanolobus psychrotolerans]